MVMINGDGDLGASKVTAEVARVMTQVPDVVESLTGVQLKQMLAGIDGKVRPLSPFLLLFLAFAHRCSVASRSDFAGGCLFAKNAKKNCSTARKGTGLHCAAVSSVS